MASPSFYIQVQSKPSFQQVEKKFTAAGKKQEEHRKTMIRTLGKSWQDEMRKEAPKGKTGKFARGIIYRTSQAGDAAMFRGYVPQPLGKWIIRGTKPHVIRAKNAKFLRFFWPRGPQGAKVYFFRKVNHPGTKANPFDKKAMAKWKPQAIVALRKLSKQYVVDVKGS